MIALTSEGAATAVAALLVILVSMAARIRARRRADTLARYRRGERDRAVQQLVADTIESCNAGAMLARRRVS